MDKYYYLAFGLEIETNIEFDQLFPLNREPFLQKKVVFTYNGIADSVKQKIQSGIQSEVNQRSYWFINHAGIFHIHDGNKIEFEEINDSGIRLVQSYVLGICIGILLAQRQMIPIHGSTVLWHDKTIVIAGDSGAGKSTLTMELLDHGAFFMADDISVVDMVNGECLVFPAFPQQKMCADTAIRNHFDIEKLAFVDEEKDKYAIMRNDIYYSQERKLDYIFSLGIGENDKIETIALNGVDKIREITNKLFLSRLYGDKMSFYPEEMGKCIEIAKMTRIYRLIRPEQADTVSERGRIIEKIIADTEGKKECQQFGDILVKKEQ